MWMLLLACGSPPSEGSVAWVTEEDGAPAVRWRSGGKEHRWEGPGAMSFPAEPDPKGTHLLVITTDEEAGHQEQLWLTPLTGGPPTRLGEPASKVRNPSWSADGQWMVVESDAHSFRDLYRVDRDGTWTRLTVTKRGSFEPDVAPDGSIAFVSSRDGNAEIYWMGPDGASPFRLTRHPGNDTQPAWSPDGTAISWLAWRGATVQLHWMERGALEPRPFRKDLHGAELDRAFVWSPAGDRVAITTQVAERGTAIDIVLTSGERVARLDGPGPDEHPTWSPDGTQLLFTSSRNGNPDLFAVDADGTGIRPVQQGAHPEWLARWGR